MSQLKEETSCFEVITPDMAVVMLENRLDGQRKIREVSVSKYAEEMRLGKWTLSPDAITLINGKLGNGRHRLSAIIQSGISQKFLVLRASDEHIIDNVDSGMGRSVADVLMMDGLLRSGDLASMSRLVLQYDKGMLTRFGQTPRIEQKKESGDRTWKTLTRNDIVSFARKNADFLVKTAQFVGALEKRHKILGRSMGGALIVLAERKHPNKGQEFIEKVYSGGTPDDAAYDMREKLIQNSVSKSRSINKSYLFGLLIKSFNHYCRGTRVGVLKIVDREPYPRII